MISRRAVIASGERPPAWRSSARGCMACDGAATLVSGCTMNKMTRMAAATSATTPAAIGRIAPLIDVLMWAPVVLGPTVGKLRQDDVDVRALLTRRHEIPLISGNALDSAADEGHLWMSSRWRRGRVYCCGIGTSCTFIASATEV